MDPTQDPPPSDGWTRAPLKLELDTEDYKRKVKEAEGLGRQLSGTLTGAFKQIAFEGKGLGDVMRSVALRISDMVLSLAMKPLEKGLGGLLQGAIGGALPFARGGVLAHGTPVPFASGGVIQSPIAFPLAGGRMGIAGERGAEAIMPLSRGPDGRLGVAVRNGGGPSITFNVTAQDAESFQRTESQIAAMLTRAVSLGQRNL